MISVVLILILIIAIYQGSDNQISMKIDKKLEEKLIEKLSYVLDKKL